jgi:hypothetical protein
LLKCVFDMSGRARPNGLCQEGTLQPGTSEFSFTWKIKNRCRGWPMRRHCDLELLSGMGCCDVATFLRNYIEAVLVVNEVDIGF